MSQQAAAYFEGSAGEVQVSGARGADLGGGNGVDGGQGDSEARERGLGTVEQSDQQVGGNRPWDACQIAHGEVARKVAEDRPLALEGPKQAAQGGGELASGGPGQVLQRVLEMIRGNFPKGRHTSRRPCGENRLEGRQVAADTLPTAWLVLTGPLAAQHVHPCADLVGDGLRQRVERGFDPGQVAVLVEFGVVHEQAAARRNWQTGLAARCVSSRVRS
ncbi:hypothetical protein ACFWWT_44795 [Streptomyces sp. NPDC058676]|uniref:hypothetical protein n=1 Tax=unclassified Streptomyces TaxID=2593676 RepID=UPI0036620B22